MMDTNNEIREIQMGIFQIFKDFEQICRDNSLTYYLIGGSMLGAVRHKGFIPWDDDMDVGMPRDDYEKFLNIILDKTNSDLLIDNSIVDNLCARDFTKLRKRINFHKNSYNVFLDVFPLDGAPSKDKIERYYKKIDTIRLIKNSHFMKTKGKTLVNKAVVFAMRLVPLKYYRRFLDRQLKKNNFYDSPAGGNFFGYPQEVMPVEYYGNPTPIYFEDGYYFGVENPDRYLTQVYGDYMKLPSLAERSNHLDEM